MLKSCLSPTLGVLIDVRHELVLEARQWIALLIQVFLVVLVKAEVDLPIVLLRLQLVLSLIVVAVDVVILFIGIAFSWLGQLPQIELRDVDFGLGLGS